MNFETETIYILMKTNPIPRNEMVESYFIFSAAGYEKKG